MKYHNTFYPTDEEIVNIWTHFIGFLIALVALVLLVLKAGQQEDLLRLISFIVFGVSMVILYLASTLYHSSKTAKLRYRLNIFDHAAIYVLIAGTYTPFTLITLKGTVGWTVFGITWSIAIIGIVYKLFFIGKQDKISTILYVLMGWIIIFAIKPLYENLSSSGLFWLALGGVLYTVGAFFYSSQKMKYNHAIFHVFVLLGSFSHFISVYFYV